MATQKRETSPKSAQEILLFKKFGRRIGEYAARRGVSIERLAYEGGVSKGYLYDLVKGKGNPSLLILYRIASALEIPIWTLLK